MRSIKIFPISNRVIIHLIFQIPPHKKLRQKKLHPPSHQRNMENSNNQHPL